MPTIRSGKLIQHCEQAIMKKREQQMNGAVLHVILVLFLAERPVSSSCSRRVLLTIERNANQSVRDTNLTSSTSEQDYRAHQRVKRSLFQIIPENSMALSLVEIERAILLSYIAHFKDLLD